MWFAYLGSPRRYPHFFQAKPPIGDLLLGSDCRMHPEPVQCALSPSKGTFPAYVSTPVVGNDPRMSP
jgi:hypothetical protein